MYHEQLVGEMPVPQERAQIRSNLTRINEELDRQMKVIDNLYQSLEVVLTPGSPEPAPMGDQPREVQAPMSDMTQNIVTRIRVLNQRLDQLLQRIEV